MSLFFQPRSTSLPDPEVATNSTMTTVAPHDPTTVVRAAVEALALGDGSGLQRIFTDDVQFRSPHVTAQSLAELLYAVCSPEPALGELEITLSSAVMDRSTVAVEWLVNATLISPLLFSDNLLIEPINDRLQLQGSSFAEFSDERIRAFRCYFDDSEMFDRVQGMPHPLRFTARWSGAPDDR